ncbi:MAG: hypothetical protein LBH00_03375 [Planctomycetaceae bacterium]|nr:hypothetical protein [Planctomycetaceae bacterium]
MQRIALTLFVFTWIISTVSAQPGRRLLERIPPFNQPNYRVGPGEKPNKENRESIPPAQEGRIVQRDGRALDRIFGIVQSVAGIGHTDAKKELKPVVIISCTGFDEFKRVVQITAKQIRLDKGSDDEPVLLNLALGLYEKIAGRGFDTKQPLGIMLQTDGVLVYPLVFTPMNLNSELGKKFLHNYTEQLADGRTAIRQDVFRWALGRLYVQEHNGWVFIAAEPQLNALPDNPATLLQGLDRQYLLAARFDLQNLPPVSAQAALTFGEMTAVNQAETELDKAFARLSIGYLRSLAEQADMLEYTVSYDEPRNDYVFVQKEIVKPKTERAKLLQERRNAGSMLHGFYHPDGAILASHFVMPLTKTQQTQLEIILHEILGKKLSEEKTADGQQQTAEGSLPDSPPKTDPQKLEHLFRQIGTAYYWALIGAIRSGQFDGATTISQEHGLLTAYKIAEGKRFQEAFDKIFEEMKTEFPDLYAKNVQKDFAESEGFRLTSVVFRAGDFIKNPLIKGVTPPKWANRETRLILGVRHDAVCFAVGQGIQPEKVLVEALMETKQQKPVQDLFFVYSAHELGKAMADQGAVPWLFRRLKSAALDTNPSAAAFAVTQFTDTSKTITLRISGLLTPSLWRASPAGREIGSP